MAIVMRVEGFANGAPCPIRGQYLVSFDFEAEHGLGFGEFTYAKDEAMKFENVVDALEYWMKVSKQYPRRLDGMPNRPLTCTTFEFVKV